MWGSGSTSSPSRSTGRSRTWSASRRAVRGPVSSRRPPLPEGPHVPPLPRPARRRPGRAPAHHPRAGLSAGAAAGGRRLQVLELLPRQGREVRLRPDRPGRLRPERRVGRGLPLRPVLDRGGPRAPHRATTYTVDAICKGTEAGAGEKRVGVLIDYGTAARRRRSGEKPARAPRRVRGRADPGQRAAGAGRGRRRPPGQAAASAASTATRCKGLLGDREEPAGRRHRAAASTSRSRPPPPPRRRPTAPPPPSSDSSVRRRTRTAACPGRWSACWSSSRSSVARALVLARRHRDA